MKTLIKAINVFSSPDDAFEEEGKVSYPQLQRVLQCFLSDHWFIQHYRQLHDDVWHIVFTKEVDDDAIDNGDDLVKKSLGLKSAPIDRPFVDTPRYTIGTIVFFAEGPYIDKQGIIVRNDEFNPFILVAIEDEDANAFDVVRIQVDDPSFILVDVDLEDEDVCQIGDIVNTIDDLYDCVVVDINVAKRMVKLYVDRDIFIDKRFDEIKFIENNEYDEDILEPNDIVSFVHPQDVYQHLRDGVLMIIKNDWCWIGYTTEYHYGIVECPLKDIELRLPWAMRHVFVDCYRYLKEINQFALNKGHPYQVNDTFFVVEGEFAGEEGHLISWNDDKVTLYLQSIDEPMEMIFNQSQVVKWIDYYKVLQEECHIID